MFLASLGCHVWLMWFAVGHSQLAGLVLSLEAEVCTRGSADQRSKKEPRLGFVCVFNSLYSDQVYLPPHSASVSARVFVPFGRHFPRVLCC